MPSDPSETLQIVFGRDLIDALSAHAARTGQTRAEIIRTATARAIGKPRLAESVKRGRPRKPE